MACFSSPQVRKVHYYHYQCCPELEEVGVTALILKLLRGYLCETSWKIAKLTSGFAFTRVSVSCKTQRPVVQEDYQ